MSRLLPPADRLVYRWSGRRRLLAGVAAPTLLLEIAGAPPVPLLYARDTAGLIVVATNWGKPEHPRWSDRLLAARAAVVCLGRERHPVSAEPLSARERDAVWPLMLTVWPAFETYRTRSGREIRVFRLTPATASADRGRITGA